MPKTDRPKRTKILRMRVSDDELEMFNKAAGVTGLDLLDWCRMAMRMEAIDVAFEALKQDLKP
jgi:hypothetical protein